MNILDIRKTSQFIQSHLKNKLNQGCLSCLTDVAAIQV